MKPVKKYMLVGSLITCIVFAVLAGAYFYIRAYTFEDCAWSAPVFAWVDENQNGSFDNNESPLEDVQFFVNDTVNQFENVGAEAVSDWNGKSNVFVWLPGCPRARFEVYAVPPSGYQFTTDKKIKVQGKGYGNEDTLQFGFSLLEGYPTPTPYVSRLTCQTYSQRAKHLLVGSDGVLWSLKYEGIASFNPASGSWVEHTPPTSQMRFLEELQIGTDGLVWVNEPGEYAARFQDSEWIEFIGEDNLVAYSEPSIGSTPDGRVWFAHQSSIPVLIAFDPQKKTWQRYSEIPGINSVRVFTDGTVWRWVFGIRSKFTIPANTPEHWSIYDEHIFTDNEILSIPVEGRVESVKIAPDGAIWLAHSSGITRFNPVTNEWYLYNSSTTNGGLSEIPNDLAFAPDGSVWIASGYAHSLAIQFTPTSADQKSGIWQQYDPRDGIPDVEKIDSIAVDRDGAIWLGFDYEDIIARCVKSVP